MYVPSSADICDTLDSHRRERVQNKSILKYIPVIYIYLSSCVCVVYVMHFVVLLYSLNIVKFKDLITLYFLKTETIATFNILLSPNQFIGTLENKVCRAA